MIGVCLNLWLAGNSFGVDRSAGAGLLRTALKILRPPVQNGRFVSDKSSVVPSTLSNGGVLDDCGPWTAFSAS